MKPTRRAGEAVSRAKSNKSTRPTSNRRAPPASVCPDRKLEERCDAEAATMRDQVDRLLRIARDAHRAGKRHAASEFVTLAHRLEQLVVELAWVPHPADMI